MRQQHAEGGVAAGQILKSQFANGLELHFRQPFDLPAHLVGNEDFARLGRGLQARACTGSQRCERLHA